MNLKSLMKQARRTNAKRDAIENRAGYAKPADMPHDGHLRVAISAIEAGITTDAWDCVAEGLDILEELHFRLTGAFFRRDLY